MTSKSSSHSSSREGAGFPVEFVKLRIHLSARWSARRETCPSPSRLETVLLAVLLTARHLQSVSPYVCSASFNKHYQRPVGWFVLSGFILTGHCQSACLMGPCIQYGLQANAGEPALVIPPILPLASVRRKFRAWLVSKWSSAGLCIASCSLGPKHEQDWEESEENHCLDMRVIGVPAL